ncbi:MAG: CCA tRNA nucleotidyltransferase [Planctomycetota bacterium]
MDHPEAQRAFATDVVRQLRDANYDALWAGGCVRDRLLGRQPKDYDIATSARPEQVRELFGRKRTLAIGAAFGVISVLGHKRVDPIEVATFRSDGNYLDGRRPEQVTFTTAEEDAQRRDFTINGLFYDPLGDRLIDYVDGERDLRAGLVRAIGDPSARFTEDKLRMLRAVRFATTFEFAIDETTRDAIRSMADEVTVVSAERIGVELRKTLIHPNRSQGVRLLHETALLHPLLPALDQLATDHAVAWQAVLTRLQRLETTSLAAAFAALLFQNADSSSIRGLARGFRYTNKEVDRVAWLVEQLPLVEQAADLPWPRLQRVLVHEGAPELLAVSTACWGAEHSGVRTCRTRLAMPIEELNPPLLLTGDDLVAQGLRPGKYFGQLLEELRDAQLEQKVETRSQALDWVDRWLADHPSLGKRP